MHLNAEIGNHFLPAITHFPSPSAPHPARIAPPDLSPQPCQFQCMTTSMSG